MMLTALGLSAGGAGTRDAHAQAAAPTAAEQEVPLTREPPFDTWCFAPLCVTPGAPQPLRPPIALPSTRDVGLLEQQLRATVVKSVEDAARDVAASWNHRASRDVLRAIGAVLSKDESALARSKGLGAAALRAGLVIETMRMVPTDTRCTGARRVDAIYEGLAIGPASALGFTEATGRVTASCVDTAKEASRAMSRAVLAALADAARPTLESAAATLPNVKTSCDPKTTGVDDATFATLSAIAELPDRLTVLDASKSLGRLRLAREALARDSVHLGDVCGKAIEASLAIDVAPLDRLASAGLGEAPVRALAEELAATTAPCKGDPTVCRGMMVLGGIAQSMMKSGGTPREQLATVIKSLVENVVPPGEDPGLALAAVKALEAAIVSAGQGATIDPDLVLAEIEKRYALDDGKPTLRTLLGLGPSPWVFELNGGVPKLDSGDFKIVGDTTLGYDGGKAFGVIVRGGVRYYDFVSPVLSTDNLDAQGWLESWLVTGDERSTFRFEGRLAGGSEYVDTTTLSKPAGLGRTNFGDYDSLLIRASLLFGFRIRPSERFGLRILGGGGFQYETFDSTSVDQNGVKFKSPDTTSGQGSGRIDARWRIVPSIVSARAHAEAQYFTITREELSFSANTTGASQTGISLTTQIQLFVNSRVFVDADIASFGGFVPAVFAGADYTYLQAPQGERSTTVPVFGVGIVRPRL